MRSTLILLTLLAGPRALAAEPLKICTDNAYWFPYIWIKDDQPRGLHISIVENALRELDIEYEFQARPWKRCLLYSEQGKVDAIASASYSDERNAYLHYPPDAGPGRFSKWQIGIASYVVITAANNPFQFDGNLEKLPEPVRAVLGYSIVADLEQAGHKVYQDKNPLTMYRALMQSEQGVIVGFESLAEKINEMESHHNKLRIHQPAVKSKSYFIPFSRKSLISEEQRMKIWDQIARTATNVRFVNRFFEELELDVNKE